MSESENTHPAAVEAGLQHQQQQDEADAARRQQQLDDQAAALAQEDEQPAVPTPDLPAALSLDDEIEL